MICKHCNKDNTEGAKFCRGCGAKLEAQQVAVREVEEVYAPPVRENTVVCPKCQKSCQAGMAFCNFCGASLKERAAENVTQYDVSMPAPAKGNKSKTNFMIISIVVCIILAALAVVFVVFKPFSSDKKGETSHQGGSGFGGAFSSPAAEETTAPRVFENITDETDTLTEDEMQALEDYLTAKENTISASIKVLIKENVTPSLQEYAKDNCVAQCGSDGILIVIDTAKNEAGIEATGKGAKFVSRDTKKVIAESVPALLRGGKYSKACEEAVNAILNEEKVSRFKAVEGAQQVVYVVKDANSNTGKLTLVEWIDGEEEILFEIDKVYLGKDGITASPSETKSATPKGTFALGFAFSDHSLDTKLDTRLITSGDVWVDDPYSNYYNTLQHGSTSNSKWSSAENTYYAFSSDVFDACILIEHNGDGYTKGVSGKGSCIYISGKNKDLSTSYGDVNISASQMKTLLSFLDEAKNPHIVVD